MRSRHVLRSQLTFLNFTLFCLRLVFQQKRDLETVKPASHLNKYHKFDTEVLTLSRRQIHTHPNRWVCVCNCTQKHNRTSCETAGYIRQREANDSNKLSYCVWNSKFDCGVNENDGGVGTGFAPWCDACKLQTCMMSSLQLTKRTLQVRRLPCPSWHHNSRSQAHQLAFCQHEAALKPESYFTSPSIVAVSQMKIHPASALE